MGSQRYNAMLPANHVRGYEERIDIVDRALDILNGQLADLTDEDQIVKMLAESIGNYVAAKYPRPLTGHQEADARRTPEK